MTSTRREPTIQIAQELQSAYDHFNRTLWNGTLPDCVITLQRQKRSYGYFLAGSYRENGGQRLCDEIAMNPTYFETKPLVDTLSTLGHEMVHLWQHHRGKPGRRGYHNREWADEMERIGLIPSDTGEPGGKRTGDRMTHYIEPGGRFEQVAEQLLADAYALTWADGLSAPSGQSSDEDGDNRSNRWKYVCPECELAVWGKPHLNVRCGDCPDMPVLVA